MTGSAIPSWFSGDLQACFPKDHRATLSLAYYRVNESERFISRFSYNGVIRFFAGQRARYGDKEHLVYDITSISSYSELLRQVRYGKNMGGEALP